MMPSKAVRSLTVFAAILASALLKNMNLEQ